MKLLDIFEFKNELPNVSFAFEDRHSPQASTDRPMRSDKFREYLRPLKKLHRLCIQKLFALDLGNVPTFFT